MNSGKKKLWLSNPWSIQTETHNQQKKSVQPWKVEKLSHLGNQPAQYVFQSALNSSLKSVGKETELIELLTIKRCMSCATPKFMQWPKVYKHTSDNARAYLVYHIMAIQAFSSSAKLQQENIYKTYLFSGYLVLAKQPTCQHKMTPALQVIPMQNIMQGYKRLPSVCIDLLRMLNRFGMVFAKYQLPSQHDELYQTVPMK